MHKKAMFSCAQHLIHSFWEIYMSIIVHGYYVSRHKLPMFSVVIYVSIQTMSVLYDTKLIYYIFPTSTRLYISKSTWFWIYWLCEHFEQVCSSSRIGILQIRKVDQGSWIIRKMFLYQGFCPLEWLYTFLTWSHTTCNTGFYASVRHSWICT